MPRLVWACPRQWGQSALSGVFIPLHYCNCMMLNFIRVDYDFLKVSFLPSSVGHVYSLVSGLCYASFSRGFVVGQVDTSILLFSLFICSALDKCDHVICN